jgi:hypothetical protein
MLWFVVIGVSANMLGLISKFNVLRLYTLACCLNMLYNYRKCGECIPNPSRILIIVSIAMPWLGYGVMGAHAYISELRNAAKANFERITILEQQVQNLAHKTRSSL